MMYHAYRTLLFRWWILSVIGFVWLCGNVAWCKKQGMLIIPGIGRADRLQTTLENLLLLDSYLRGDSPSWDCVVYLYALYNDTSFWSLGAQLQQLHKYCNVVEHPGRRVTENLYLAQPALMAESYEYVFVLLDDCKLLAKSKFPLDYVINIMIQNQLTVASPMVIGANKGGGQQFRNIMQTMAQPGTVGYVSQFVELFAWITTMPAYEALWQLLCPSINPYGWGYDLWYHTYAESRVKGHKMGIISAVSVRHEQNLLVAGEGRTESASIDQKWNALQAQEVHYRQHLGIPLRKCRLKLSNHTLFGAVTGFLLDTTSSGSISSSLESIIDKKLHAGEEFPRVPRSGHRKRKGLD